MDLATALLAGYCVVASEAGLDALDSELMNRVASARNRRRLGVRDEYVAWIPELTTPKDLEYLDGYALASGFYLSEIK